MIKNEILLTNENYITFVNTKNKSKKISHEWYANYEKLKKYVNDENVIEFKHKQDPQLYYWILKEKHDSKTPFNIGSYNFEVNGTNSYTQMKPILQNRSEKIVPIGNIDDFPKLQECLKRNPQIILNPLANVFLI